MRHDQSRPHPRTTTSSGAPDLNSYFTVERVNASFRRAVPRRISSVRPFKGITNFDTNWMKLHAYEAANLSEYDQCWTGEMSKRPIPFVSSDRKPLNTQEVFAKYLPAVMAHLLPLMTPAIQTINKISSLGYPINANPGSGIDRDTGTQVFQNKFNVVLTCFREMQKGDFTVYEHGYHTIGCRKQNEPPSRKRDFQFIDSSGKIYQEEITAAQRVIEVPQLGEMIGSRTRTIVRPPVVNLYLQCWDTVLHNAIKKNNLCMSNVYTEERWPTDATYVTFDCKHYERYLGLCAITYAEYVGGIYATQLLQLIKYPFIVPSDDWRTFWLIQPDYRPGVYPQFSSGLSPVAPLGKLVNITVQVAYFVEVKGMSQSDAVLTVLSGTSSSLRRWSFGDDNRLMGSKDEIKSFCNFMENFFDIEIDEQPTYLGTVWRADQARWLLPAKTYNLKLYQPERDYEWKDFPNLGMVERRAVFSQFGEPEIASKIIPYEDTLWDAIGHPFIEIAHAAVIEKMKANRQGVHLNDYMLSDKDYLLSDEQKVESGLFWYITSSQVATIVTSLVGEQVLRQLKFKDVSPSLIPEPKAVKLPFTDNPFLIDENEDENYENQTTSEV